MTTANRYLDDKVKAIEEYLETHVATKEGVAELRKEMNEQFKDVKTDIEEILKWVRGQP